MRSIPVLSPQEASAWDRAAESAGISLFTLMESAGRAAADVIARRYAEHLRDGVVVAAGLGNNGGDGWVVARVLHHAGVPIWVTSVPGDPNPLASTMKNLALATGVRQVPWDGPWPNVGLLVDALLGTGARGAPRAPIGSLMERLQDLRLPIIAIDGPTGLDLASGVSHLPARSDLSITFGGVRRGHLLARDEVGSVVVVEIGHPPVSTPWPLLVTDAMAADWLPRAPAKAHKGDRGRLVVIGGNTGMSGAVRLASRSAFGAGAGLIHAVAPADTVGALVVAEPDVQTLAHHLELPLSAALRQLLERADTVIIGPGLGRADSAAEFVLAVLEASRRAVVDADALTVLQGKVGALRNLGQTRSFVLTPHQGEFRTLFSEHVQSLESDPWSAAEAAASDAAATVLLKGVPTVISRAGATSFTVAAGNPGLATGGSGDVLSGLIGAFLAQNLEPGQAAALGAQVLGRAADLAARRTSTRTLRPMDVVATLPDLWRAWEMIRTAPPSPRLPVVLELEMPQQF